MEKLDMEIIYSSLRQTKVDRSGYYVEVTGFRPI